MNLLQEIDSILDELMMRPLPSPDIAVRHMQQRLAWLPLTHMRIVVEIAHKYVTQALMFDDLLASLQRQHPNLN